MEIKGKFSLYKCDFCEDCEMFSCEENWERLEDGRDRCVPCLIKQRNELELQLSEMRNGESRDIIICPHCGKEYAGDS